MQPSRIFVIMEILTHKSLIDLLLITLLTFFCISHALSPPGMVQLNQQLLLSSLDSTSASSQPFLTSPSGTYEAYLVRTRTGSGDSFCSIQVQGQGGRSSSSSSNIIGCGPISGSHVCSLVFSTIGLGIFDGRSPTWSTSIHSGHHAKDLILLDSGDMEISDSSGRIAWKASESRIVVDRSCGSGPSSSEESFGQEQPLDQSGEHQDSEMGDLYHQQQEGQGKGNYPKQSQGRNSGVLAFDKQPHGADDQEGYTDNDDDDAAFENDVSGRGIEILGVVIVSFIYLIIVVS